MFAFHSAQYASDAKITNIKANHVTNTKNTMQLKQYTLLDANYTAHSSHHNLTILLTEYLKKKIG